LGKVERILNRANASGIGVYFSAPSLADIPDEILAHLGNRVVHASHASTQAEQRSLRLMFRNNPRLDLSQALIKLGTGEALVSTLDADGNPTMVEHALIKPPNSRVGVLSNAERKAVIDANLNDRFGTEFARQQEDHDALQNRIFQLDRGP
jgi:DNA double-strand break repair helicase HerA and related ATPase